MPEITYKFGYDEIFSKEPKECIEIADQKMTERLVSVCDDFRAAISESGQSLTGLGRKSNQTCAAICKSLSGSFSMSPERLDLFCGELFPLKTLDEIFFGENIPMPIPNIDLLYLTQYSYLLTLDREKTKEDTTFIRKYINEKESVNVTPFYRYFGVREDRGVDDPIPYKFRTFPQTKNLTAISMWRSEHAHPNVKTLMKASLFANMSLQFLCRSDYSMCNLYYVKDGKKTFIQASDKKLLKKYCTLSYEDKCDVLTKIAERIDYKKFF